VPAIEDEKRESEKVIAVKVTYEHDLDLSRWDTGPPQLLQDSRAAVEEVTVVKDEGAEGATL
jgi:hypothetical protein